MPRSTAKVDSDLLRLLRDGDALAFGKIYEIFAPTLYRRLFRLLKDVDMVEEILQDTFLKLWEKREQIDPDQGFKTYLYRIADHLAIDLFRKISRDKALQQELWASAISFHLHTEEAFLAKEQRQLLSMAIDRLPPKRKEILIRCKLEDRSYQEVAEMMGISVSTVSNQLVKAVREVKDYVLQTTHGERAAIFSILLLTQI